jgi:hypothetical protein
VERRRTAWNKTAPKGAFSGVKVGRKLSAQLFQSSLFISPKHALDGIFHGGYIHGMTWDVEYTDEFGDWWAGLTEDEQVSLAASVQLLEARGPALGHPHSSGIHGSKHGHMRELRTQHGGRPFRTLYAFDPRRMAILLIGGDKTGDDRWYDVNVPIADRLYDQHLVQLRQEGAIDG